MFERLRNALPAFIGLLLFAVALEVLCRELHAVSWHQLTTDIFSIPGWQLGLALLLTALNYALLTGHDFLAFAYIGKRLPAQRIALASFIAYAIANSVGFAMLSGASVRYRFYTRWGVTADELSRIVFSYVVTFWLGLLLLGGLSLAASRLPDALDIPAPGLIAPIGWLLILASVAYVAAAFVRREPIRFRQFELPLPSPRIAVSQLAVSVLDWTVAGAVLYVLLPPSGLSFLALLGAFLAAQLLGLASHIPGGVGVFEGLMVLLLKPFLDSGTLVPAVELHGQVSRFLRASVGAAVTLLLFAIARLIGCAPHKLTDVTDADLAAVEPIIARQTLTFPYLVYLRDKALLFDTDKKGFVMYGVRGRTWVALGDPIAPSDRVADLIRIFLEKCDDFGGVPVFYEVRKDQLHRYADFGLTAVRLGEEAAVDVNKFTLEGGAGTKYRQALRRLEKDRATFRIVAPDGVAGIIEQLREVSDDWLKEKAGSKRGSLSDSSSPTT